MGTFDHRPSLIPWTIRKSNLFIQTSVSPIHIIIFQKKVLGKFPQKILDNVHFILQIHGKKSWTLKPPPECFWKCNFGSEISATMEAGTVPSKKTSIFRDFPLQNFHVPKIDLKSAGESFIFTYYFLNNMKTF